MTHHLNPPVSSYSCLSAVFEEAKSFVHKGFIGGVFQNFRYSRLIGSEHRRDNVDLVPFLSQCENGRFFGVINMGMPNGDAIKFNPGQSVLERCAHFLFRSEQIGLSILFRFFSCCHGVVPPVAAVMVAGLKNSPIVGGNRDLISVAVSLFGRATANRSPNIDKPSCSVGPAGDFAFFPISLPLFVVAMAIARQIKRCAIASNRVDTVRFHHFPEQAGKGSLVCLLLPIPAAAWVPARCAAATSLLRVARSGFALHAQPAGAI